MAKQDPTKYEIVAAGLFALAILFFSGVWYVTTYCEINQFTLTAVLSMVLFLWGFALYGIFYLMKCRRLALERERQKKKI